MVQCKRTRQHLHRVYLGGRQAELSRNEAMGRDSTRSGLCYCCWRYMCPDCPNSLTFLTKAYALCYVAFQVSLPKVVECISPFLTWVSPI